jgi:hypothetical protein
MRENDVVELFVLAVCELEDGVTPASFSKKDIIKPEMCSNIPSALTSVCQSVFGQ